MQVFGVNWRKPSWTHFVAGTSSQIPRAESLHLNLTSFAWLASQPKSCESRAGSCGVIQHCLKVSLEGLTKSRSATFWVPSGTFFLCLRDPQSQQKVSWSQKSLRCARFSTQTATKTVAVLWPKDSGKKKAHKHKSFWPVTPPVTGGSPDREARGQSFMCYPRNPRNINLFVRIPDREDRWPGRPEKVLCAKLLCAFSAP